MPRSTDPVRHVKSLRSQRRWAALISSAPAYLLLLPAVLYVLIYSYLTLPYIYLAFSHYNVRSGIFNSPFAGLKNFEFFFKSQSAAVTSWNTIKFNVINLVFGSALSLLLALFLNEIRSKLFVRITQSTMIFPFFVSWAAVSFFVFNILATETGFVNTMLKQLGQKPVFWYGMPQAWTFIIALIVLWKSVGMSSVIYVAAISGIDQEMFEAAVIDGANRWQKARYITLPSLAPIVGIIVLLSIGRIFNGDFGMMYAIVRDNGVLFPTTDIIDTYVYRALRKTGDPSTAMAVSLIQSLVGFFTVLITNSIIRRVNPEAALF